MRAGLTISILLHIVIFAITIYKMPDLFKKSLHQDYSIIVDIVDVSEISNVKVKKSQQKQAKKDSTKKEQKPKEKGKKIESNKKEIKKDNTAPQKKKTEKIKPEPKKSTKTEPQKSETKRMKDNFEELILKSIENNEPKSEVKEIDKLAKDSTKETQGVTNKEFNENLPLTISEIDSIKSQISSNWNTTSFSGANSKGMEVIVLITLDIEGNVVSVRAKDSYTSSAYYSAFVDSAIRSVKLASPIKNLNKSKYNSWKEIEFRFDSSGMIY